MTNLIPDLIAWATEVIRTIGYSGIAFLIALESVFPPIPSEVILPLSGSLSSSGVFFFPFALLAATLGSMAGADILYSIGRWGGETRIGNWLDRYGKFLLLTRDDLYKSRDWFAKHGTYGVLFARLIPGVRSIVSIPAGLAEMPYLKFALLTGVGSGIWNGSLMGAGFYLGQNWDTVKDWIAPFGPIVYGIILLVVGTFVIRRLWTKFGPPSRSSTPPTNRTKSD